MIEETNQTAKVLALEEIKRLVNEGIMTLDAKLAAMTQERDALRREVELKDKQIRLMAIRCAKYCTVSECCPKQPVDGRLDNETCYQCQTERSAKAAQAWKGEG